jgi:hypothetical protein
MSANVKALRSPQHAEAFQYCSLEVIRIAAPGKNASLVVQQRNGVGMEGLMCLP